MKILRLSLFMPICVLFVFEVYAQAPDTLWTRRFGDIRDDSGASVQQTMDGGFIIAGHTSENLLGRIQLDYDVWLVKTDDLGNMLWNRTFGGTGEDRAYSVIETSDSGYVITGVTQSFGAGGRDAYLIKTDKTGTLQWESTFGGSGNDYAYDVALTYDGGYILVGTSPCINGGNDIYLVKVTDIGNMDWATTFCAYYDANARSVIQAYDGGFVLAGDKYIGAGMRVGWLIKTNSSGDLEWSRELTKHHVYDYGMSVAHTADSGYIVCGHGFNYPDAGFDTWLTKCSESGNAEWFYHYGGEEYEYANSVRSTFDGGYILTGRTQSYGAGGDDLYIVKTDCSGIMEWESVYGWTNTDVGRSVQLTSGGGFIIAGVTRSISSSYDIWLLNIEPPTEISGPVTDQARLDITGVYPNPFSSILSISYSLPEPSLAEMSIYDLSGRLVDTVLKGFTADGNHTVAWDPGVSIPDGCYLVVLDAGGERTARRCVKLN
jgi:hypothetical protein